MAEPAPKLKNKVSVITGGASGIGETAARLFSEHGARVVIADIDDEKGRRVEREIKGAGGDSLYVHADITQPEQVGALMQAAAQRWGGIDILFNNAGVLFAEGPVEESDPALFAHIVAVHLTGAYLCARYALPHLLTRGGGSIIGTGSVAANVATGDVIAYSASKAALHSMTQTLAIAYGARGVRANTVSPGAAATPMMINNPSYGSRTEEQVLARLATLQPVPRACLPIDVARAALWLASDDASFVNGLDLVVDGGYSAGRWRPQVAKGSAGS